MYHQLKILVKYLDFFYNLMDGKAPHQSQIAIAESIPPAIKYFEDELEKILPVLEQCNKKDYEKINDLFFEVFRLLKRYTLNVETFDFVWFDMWRCYYKQEILEEINRPFSDEALPCNRMETIIKRIFDLVLKFNSLPRKKIIHKSDLERIKVQVRNFSKVSREMGTDINALANIDVYKIKPSVDCLLAVGTNISDYCCELEFVRDAMQTIGEAYRLKDKNLKIRRTYC